MSLEQYVKIVMGYDGKFLEEGLKKFDTFVGKMNKNAEDLSSTFANPDVMGFKTFATNIKVSQASIEDMLAKSSQKILELRKTIKDELSSNELDVVVALQDQLEVEGKLFAANSKLINAKQDLLVIEEKIKQARESDIKQAMTSQVKMIDGIKKKETAEVTAQKKMKDGIDKLDDADDDYARKRVEWHNKIRVAKLKEDSRSYGAIIKESKKKEEAHKKESSDLEDIKKKAAESHKKRIKDIEKEGYALQVLNKIRLWEFKSAAMSLAGGVGSALLYVARVTGKWAMGMLDVRNLLASIMAITGGGVLLRTFKEMGLKIFDAGDKMNDFRAILRSTLGDAALANRIIAETIKITKDLPMTFQQATDAIRGFTLIPPIRAMLANTKNLKKDMGDLLIIVNKLAVIDPVQGVGGAIFALREAFSGEVLSLKRRFELPVQYLAISIGKTMAELKKDPMLMKDALVKFLDQAISDDAMKQFSEKVKIQMDKLKDTIFQFNSFIANQGSFRGVSLMIRDVRTELTDLFGSDFGKQMGASISKTLMDTSKRMKNVAYSAIENLGKTKVFGDLKADSTVGKALEMATKLYRTVGDVIVKIAEAFTSMSAMKGYVTFVDTLFKGASLYYKAASIAIKTILGGVSELVNYIKDNTFDDILGHAKTRTMAFFEWATETLIQKVNWALSSIFLKLTSVPLTKEQDVIKKSLEYDVYREKAEIESLLSEGKSLGKHRSRLMDLQMALKEFQSPMIKDAGSIAQPFVKLFHGAGLNMQADVELATKNIEEKFKKHGNSGMVNWMSKSFDAAKESSKGLWPFLSKILNTATQFADSIPTLYDNVSGLFENMIPSLGKTIESMKILSELMTTTFGERLSKNIENSSTNLTGLLNDVRTLQEANEKNPPINIENYGKLGGKIKEITDLASNLRKGVKKLKEDFESEFGLIGKLMTSGNFADVADTMAEVTNELPKLAKAFEYAKNPVAAFFNEFKPDGNVLLNSVVDTKEVKKGMDTLVAGNMQLQYVIKGGNEAAKKLEDDAFALREKNADNLFQQEMKMSGVSVNRLKLIEDQTKEEKKVLKARRDIRETSEGILAIEESLARLKREQPERIDKATGEANIAYFEKNLKIMKEKSGFAIGNLAVLLNDNQKMIIDSMKSNMDTFFTSLTEGVLSVENALNKLGDFFNNFKKDILKGWAKNMSKELQDMFTGSENYTQGQKKVTGYAGRVGFDIMATTAGMSLPPAIRTGTPAGSRFQLNDPNQQRQRQMSDYLKPFSAGNDQRMLSGLAAGAGNMAYTALIFQGISNRFGPTKYNTNPDSEDQVKKLNEEIRGIESNIYDYAISNFNIADEILKSQFEKGRIVLTESGKKSWFAKHTITSWGENQQAAVDSIAEFMNMITDDSLKSLKENYEREIGTRPEQSFSEIAADYDKLIKLNREKIMAKDREIEAEKETLAKMTDAKERIDQFNYIKDLIYKKGEEVIQATQAEYDLEKKKLDQINSRNKSAYDTILSLRGEDVGVLQALLSAGSIEDANRITFNERMAAEKRDQGEIGKTFKSDAARLQYEKQLAAADLAEAERGRKQTQDYLNNARGSTEIANARDARYEAEKLYTEALKRNSDAIMALKDTMAEMSEMEKMKLQNEWAGMSAEEIAGLSAEEVQKYLASGANMDPRVKGGGSGVQININALDISQNMMNLTTLAQVIGLKMNEMGIRISEGNELVGLRGRM